MTKTLIETVTQTEKGNRLFQQERAILMATELICELMERENVSLSQLARRLGETENDIKRILDGRAVLTIPILSDILVALNHTLKIG